MRIIERLHALARRLDPFRGELPFTPPPHGRPIDPAVFSLFTLASLFSALLFTAPAALPPGSAGDLSGAVASIDNAAVWSTFPQPFQWVYKVGDQACHTKLSRSFVINGNQMPFCARDSGIFVGATIGLALCAPTRTRLYRWAVRLPWYSYLVLLLPIAVDGIAQNLFGFESDNFRRVLTGLLAGLAVALALAYIAYEASFAVSRAKASREGRRRIRDKVPD